MNIWIVHQYAYTPSSSASTRHYELARRLIERGHVVKIFASSFDHKLKRETRKFNGNTILEENVGCVPFLWVKTPAYKGNSIGRLWSMLVFFVRVLRLAKRYQDEKPDVIIGSTPSLFAAFAANRAAQRLGVPFCAEVRDLWPLTLMELGGLSKWHPVCVVFSFIERYIYRHSDGIISLLPAAKTHFESVAGVPVSVHWIPNGVNLSKNDPSKVPVPSAFRMVYAGAHGPANDLETVLSAAALLKGEYSSDGRPLQFHFYGNGTEKRSLQRLAKELCVDNVYFHDAVPKHEIMNILEKADAFVACVRPSELYRFGVSLNKLYDYMAAAKPVVLGIRAANNPVQESGCGISVTPGNPRELACAIRHLLALSPKERMALGCNGRQFVEERHDFDVLGAKLEAALCQCIEAYRNKGGKKGTHE